jgi:stress response protein YsnF
VTLACDFFPVKDVDARESHSQETGQRKESTQENKDMTNTMESTIVAAYKTDAKAQAAVQELEKNNVPRDHIHVHGDGGTQTGTQHEGGFMGWVKSLFGEEEKSYTTAYRDGDTIVAVDASNNQIDAIADILDRFDPVNLEAQSTTATGAGAGTKGTREKTSSVPVVEEDVAVGKRSYERGGVRVYSHVVDKPVEEKVRLREEKVYVDRQPADRPATEDDLKGKQDQVLEVKEYAEEPVIEKRARVVEDVRVGKDVSDRTETIRDSVRRTEVDVEPLGSRAGGGAIDDTEFRRHFQQTYGASGANYADYGPAYEYGYTSASDPQYRNRSFDEAEADLRSGYERRYPKSTWDKVKDSVRYGWNRVTRKA